MTSYKSSKQKQSEIKKWWNEKRLFYNISLIISGIIAFILYVLLGNILIVPYENDFEITLFTTVFQGFGYLIMICFANLFYNLGYLFDKKFNTHNSEKFRKKIFNLGYWFSDALPFVIPINIIIIYFLNYFKY